MLKPNLSQVLFVMLMLMSGFAGISYEIFYGRILGNMVGDQFVVSAAVLMTFLLGIGLGSLYAHRLWRWLWAIEGGIGLYGLFLVYSQSFIEKVVYAGAALFPDQLLGSILVCVLLLITPAFLIGCSVPLFAGYFSRQTGQSGDAFPWVYMGYNLGAALTSLLIEFLLLRYFGIKGSVTLFAMVNLIIAIGLKTRFSNLASNLTESECSSGVRNLFYGIGKRVWFALVLASVASAVFQLFMVKYAELIFGPFRESFALVLSIVLLGITLGSWVVKQFRLSFAVVMWVNLIALIGLMFMAGPSTYVYAALYPLTGDSFALVVLLKWLILMGLMMLPAMSFGATIPALLSHDGEVSHESGTLLFVSSIANVLGFLLMVFLLHRFFDYGVQLLAVGVISSLALLVWKQVEWKRVVGVVACVGFLGLGFLYHWDEDLLYLSYTNFKDAEDLQDARDGIEFPERYKGYQDVFSINWMDGDPYFFINGYISIPLNNPSEKIVGAMSSLFSHRLDDALVLGLGSGATASSVGLFFDHTDVVEINPVVRENLFRMERWNFDIENNPRVDIHVDDAIHYVKAGEKDYSLILNTVTTPLYFSSSKLYTKDFFDSVKKRLKEDGVYVTWMDSRIGDKGTDIILRSLNQSFEYCAVSYIKAAYFLLIASDKPLSIHQQDVIASHQGLKNNLMEKHGIMASWLQYQLMTTDVFPLIGDQHAPINTADYPALEFEMARLQESGIPGFRQRLLSSFDIDALSEAMPSKSEAFPADLLRFTEMRLDDSTITRRWQRLLADQVTENKRDLAELDRRRVEMETSGNVSDMHAFGYQLMRLERYNEAIDVFSRVLEMEGEHDNAHYNLGACYENLDRYEEALREFELELKIDPEDEDALYRIGRIQVRMKRYKAAVDALTEYLRLVPGSERAYFYRALANKGLGQAQLAKDDVMMSLGLGGGDRQLANQVQLLGY